MPFVALEPGRARYAASNAIVRAGKGTRIRYVDCVTAGCLLATAIAIPLFVLPSLF